jgi:hypothetical protein
MISGEAIMLEFGKTIGQQHAQANCETVMLERNGKVREFKPSAKGRLCFLDDAGS